MAIKITWLGHASFRIEGEVERIDLALLPVGGTYTLGAAEAARALEAIGCKQAVGYHWGDIVGSIDDAKRFAQHAPCAVSVIQPGESMTL